MKFLSARANERASEKVDRRGAEGGGRGGKRQQSSRAYIGEYEKGCDFFFRITSPSLCLSSSLAYWRARYALVPNIRCCMDRQVICSSITLQLTCPHITPRRTLFVQDQAIAHAALFLPSSFAILTVARDESVISEAKAAIPCAPIAEKRKERDNNGKVQRRSQHSSYRDTGVN